MFGNQSAHVLLGSLVRGTTNTAAALQFVTDSVFTGRDVDGDRGGVQNVVVLVTAGASDSEEATQRAASTAKQRGTHVIAIGETRTACHAEGGRTTKRCGLLQERLFGFCVGK